jgi:hypothetical protein
MRKKKYPSDVSGEKFELIRPMLEGVRRQTIESFVIHDAQIR